MEYLLCSLIERIAREMPEIYHIDEDYGQLEGLADESREDYPISFPAVFLDAPKADWSDCSDGLQLGTAEVRVRLAIDCYDDTHAGSLQTDKIRDRDLLRQRLNQLLHGYNIEGYGALMRTKTHFYTITHGIKVYEAVYTIGIHEQVIESGREPLRTPLRIALAVEGDKSRR